MSKVAAAPGAPGRLALIGGRPPWAERVPLSGISALREKGILSGKRIERAERAEPGKFDKLPESELDALLVEEYEKIQALRARPADNDDCEMAKH
jgi:hypothetical protein